MAGSTIFFVVLVGAVGALRLIEMRLSRRHQRALAESGAAVLPERVFPAMVALHTGVLVAAVIEALLLSRPFVPALAIPTVALVVLANALRFWVIATLGVHWNVRVVPSMPLGVVTSGPYRYVRHPIYSLRMLMNLAVMVMVPTPLVILAAGTDIILLQIEARREERYMESKHGPVYAQYKNSVGRFVPRPFVG